MFALVQEGSIVSYPKGNKGITIDDVQYPQSIFTLWTEAERNAIGIYTVIEDNSKKKSEEFYINTNQTITYDNTDDEVTASYGNATAKQLDDEDAVDENGDPILDENGDQLVNYGLKTKYKNQFNAQAKSLLEKTDWYVIKATDVESYSVPSNITTYRTQVRAKVNAMEADIDDCSTVEELITLLSYTTNDAGVSSRPLGEFPDEVV
tara:strand:- start:2841 stop:3461 length:621 start_codon:yes stop_codon:yes gene_type:complete